MPHRPIPVSCILPELARAAGFNLLTCRKSHDKFRPHDGLQHPSELARTLLPVSFFWCGDVEVERRPGTEEDGEEGRPDDIKSAPAIGLTDPSSAVGWISRIHGISGGGNGNAIRQEQRRERPQHGREFALLVN